MGTTIFYSALLITCIFITDIIHRIVDPYSFYYVRRGCLDGAYEINDQLLTNEEKKN